MKKAINLFVMVSVMLLLLSITAIAAMPYSSGINPLSSLRVYATSSLYAPPSDKAAAGSALMVGLGAEYRFGSDWAVNAEYDSATYQRPLGSETITPMSLDVKRYFNGIPFATAYVGAGLNSTNTSYNGTTAGTTGYQAMVGCSLGLAGAGLNFEAKYQVLDSSKPDQGGCSLGASISGSSTMFF